MCDDEIHNSIAAAFGQNCHTSAKIPNIAGMASPVGTKQAVNDSARGLGLDVLVFVATYARNTFHMVQDNEIHNSIVAAFGQNCHSSVDIPNILGMVFPKQAANDSTRIVTRGSI